MGEILRLRRSLLFVPGAEPRKLERARQSDADTLILDLEDSVAPDRKDEARRLVSELLREGAANGAELAVRLNAPGTPQFEADLETVVAAGGRTLMIPKAESAGGLAEVSERARAIETNLAGAEAGRTRLLALVENAAGIARATELAGGTPRVEALCFGHVDFCLDMGLAESDASQGVALHARCSLAIAAKASGVAPIDCVCLAVQDAEAFRRDAALGQSLGFEGKLCIHPEQVAIANDLYTPSAGEIEAARRVIEGWEQAQAQGRGVFTLDRKMVDAPVVAVQKRILERARLAGVLSES